MLWRFLPTLCLPLMALAVFTTGARAEPAKAELGEKGRNQAVVSQGGFKAMLLYRPGTDGGANVKVPHLYLMQGQRTVITLKGVTSGSDWPPAEAFIAEMDPSNPYPEVVFSSYTGGAHCCSHVLVATSSADGQSWRALYLGDYDGGFRIEDVDGDGRYEFLVSDQRFNYTFSSYAGSAPPPLIYQLSGMKLNDATRLPAFRPHLLQELARKDRQIADIDEQHERNGLLAGYVALKALLGQGADGWATMMKLHDRKATDGLTGCTAGLDKHGKCKAPETRFPAYPAALEAFLRRTGYL